MIIFNMQVSAKQCQFVFHTLSNTVLVDANATNTFLSSRTQATLGSGILVQVSVYNSLTTHKLEFVIVLAAEIIQVQDSIAWIHVFVTR